MHPFGFIDNYDILESLEREQHGDQRSMPHALHSNNTGVKDKVNAPYETIRTATNTTAALNGAKPSIFSTLFRSITSRFNFLKKAPTAIDTLPIVNACNRTAPTVTSNVYSDTFAAASSSLDINGFNEGQRRSSMVVVQAGNDAPATTSTSAVPRGAIFINLCSSDEEEDDADPRDDISIISISSDGTVEERRECADCSSDEDSIVYIRSFQDTRSKLLRLSRKFRRRRRSRNRQSSNRDRQSSNRNRKPRKLGHLRTKAYSVSKIENRIIQNKLFKVARLLPYARNAHCPMCGDLTEINALYPLKAPVCRENEFLCLGCTSFKLFCGTYEKFLEAVCWMKTGKIPGYNAASLQRANRDFRQVMSGRAKAHRARQLRKLPDHKFTTDGAALANLCLESRFLCAVTKQPVYLIPTREPFALSLDHISPVSDGQPHTFTIENLQIMSSLFNSIKQSYSNEEIARYYAQLLANIDNYIPPSDIQLLYSKYAN